MLLSIEEMALLPAPTAEVCRAFVEHVCWAHSWYKHLSLVRPSRFVVFLAPDAGGDHDEARPRLHHSWRTTAEYRRRFGYLDFQWRHPDDAEWRRDAGSTVSLPDAIAAACGFELGPLCSNDDNAIDVICSFWSSASGEAGWYPDEQALVSPPVRAQIDRLDELVKAASDAYHDLSEEEKGRAFDDERPAATPGLARYDAVQAELQAFHEELRRPERARIELALTRLLDLLASARPSPGA
jgi:hypothetical protein